MKKKKSNVLKKTKLIEGDAKNGIIGIYKDELLIKQIPYKNKKVDGIVKTYNENGVCIEETEYKDGTKNGISRKFDEKGRIKDETYYENGKIEGKSITYYNNGQIESICNYSKGMKMGDLKVYNRDGCMVYNSYHENNSILSINNDIYDRHCKLNEFDDFEY